MQSIKRLVHKDLRSESVALAGVVQVRAQPVFVSLHPAWQPAALRNGEIALNSVASS